MIEHRLIEKMLTVIAAEARRIKNGGKIDPLFIDVAVDFIRTYADRTHHGKEEDILFQELARKPLGKADSLSMAELVDEHRQARQKVKALVNAKERFGQGITEAAREIISLMEWLADFYPRHIRKEDKDFFPRTEAYFTRDELDAMLLAFRDFDAKMIHEKYEKLVKGFPA
ncbi:MAG: hemerythrin domain-containing protein [Spirochaetia bacterium]|jgi:hemerythrin-like domain-containing protein